MPVIQGLFLLTLATNMFRKLPPVPLVLALVLIVPCEVSFAQFSAVTGVVRDPNGGVIPGVTVTTIPQSGGVVRHTTSGRDGCTGSMGCRMASTRSTSLDRERPCLYERLVAKTRARVLPRF